MGFKGVYITRTCFPDEEKHNDTRIMLNVFNVLYEISIIGRPFKVFEGIIE